MPDTVGCLEPQTVPSANEFLYDTNCNFTTETCIPATTSDSRIRVVEGGAVYIASVGLKTPFNDLVVTGGILDTADINNDEAQVAISGGAIQFLEVSGAKLIDISGGEVFRINTSRNAGVLIRDGVRIIEDITTRGSSSVVIHEVDFTPVQRVNTLNHLAIKENSSVFMIGSNFVVSSIDADNCDYSEIGDARVIHNTGGICSLSGADVADNLINVTFEISDAGSLIFVSIEDG